MIVEYYYRWVEAKYFIYYGEKNYHYYIESLRTCNECEWIVPGTVME